MLKADGRVLSKIRYSRNASLGEWLSEAHLESDVDPCVRTRGFAQSTSFSGKAKEIESERRMAKAEVWVCLGTDLLEKSHLVQKSCAYRKYCMVHPFHRHLGHDARSDSSR